MPRTWRQVEEDNRLLAGKAPEEILRWTEATFRDVVSLTAFGYSGVVLLDYLRRFLPRVEILFIDTGRHFPETLALRDHYRDALGLRVTTVRAGLPAEEMDAQYGADLHARDADLCCRLRKVEPLEEALRGRDAIICALRQQQSPTRADLKTVEIDAGGRVRVYPIVDWDRRRSWDYIRARGLPYSPLHDRGYPSVGCAPCTVPVAPGDDERKGRWTSIPKLECGIHCHAGPGGERGKG